MESKQYKVVYNPTVRNLNSTNVEYGKDDSFFNFSKHRENTNEMFGVTDNNSTTFSKNVESGEMCKTPRRSSALLECPPAPRKNQPFRPLFWFVF